eukprot:3527681-Rhodomonas_salina.1
MGWCEANKLCWPEDRTFVEQVTRRYPSTLIHCEIKRKKTQSQYSLYQECAVRPTHSPLCTCAAIRSSHSPHCIRICYAIEALLARGPHLYPAGHSPLSQYAARYAGLGVCQPLLSGMLLRCSIDGPRRTPVVMPLGCTATLLDTTHWHRLLVGLRASY